MTLLGAAQIRELAAQLDLKPSKSATTGASFGCKATAANTDVFHFSAACTHHLDCSAE